ncbi:MAG: DNA-directed RNA polymerase subunit beta [Deltaproteobacteria bacterium]|nr:DNA-directed RNA polymerase subunit beta [Deltaproteobacteria bacterium]
MPKISKPSLRVRRNFSKIPAAMDVPDLIEVQKRSYSLFLQDHLSSDKREATGLQAAFESVFPISDFNETLSLEFVDYSLGEPKYDILECLQRGTNYAAPLRVRVRLIVYDLPEEGEGSKSVRDIKEQEVYMGEIPLMTPNGTFIINGTERVIVTQLHRSPGAFFSHDKGKAASPDKYLYTARIIPYRGSWLDFEFDAKDLLYVRIDRRRKLPATILLRALEYSTEELLRIYYHVEKFHVGEKRVLVKEVNPDTLKGTTSTSNIYAPGTRKILVKEGHKFTKIALKRITESGLKEIKVTPEELVGRVVLGDIVDPGTGEVLVEGNTELTEETVGLLLEKNVREFELLFMDNVHASSALRDTLAHDKISTPQEAMIEIYKRMRPGEPPTLDTARDLFHNLFFNPRRYDLSPVGRLKMNHKLGFDIPMTTRTLTKEDIIGTVKHLIDLKNGVVSVDDIDHLGNRRVRSVGELLENQIRIGLVRMERTIRERMNLQDSETVLPKTLINAKPVSAAIKEFFGSSQLSQFMDQTNPLSEITHKRRLSALGPGGLTRERAGFAVRDVHPTHYGRICPIETPEGPNIGLITSLSTYARVSDYGFIEAPFRKVVEGRATSQVDYLTALEGEKYVIAQANTPLDEDGKISVELVSARSKGDFLMVPPEQIDYMDVSPKQMVSVATSLIPFLEHDDANRALMGSNMQRQAVPLLKTEAPIVGTGMEAIVARDSGAVSIARRSGVVDYVDAEKIVVKTIREKKGKESVGTSRLDIYNLLKYKRSNQNTCINQKPIVKKGDRVAQGQIIADGPATEQGELALGQNALVAFMPWRGYNYEDAILISEEVVREDRFTSIHIEEFSIEARDTKLGQEDVTRDIPNVSEEALRNLDESGIIRVGAEVKHGDILVGKVTPKGETQLTPEEKLLRAIFGEKAGDVRDASLKVPPGIAGTVVDVKVFVRRGVEKDERALSIENEEIERIRKDYEEELRIIEEEHLSRKRSLLVGYKVRESIRDEASGKVLVKKGGSLSADLIESLPLKVFGGIEVAADDSLNEKLEELEDGYRRSLDDVHGYYDEKINRVRKGDELPPGVIKMVKVYVAMKRRLSVGDKMAGRHGNKGVVSKILPVEDMPYLPDGTPVDIVLNPLGVPSRMNIGQVLETHLGWAAKALGIHIATPVFDGATETEIKALLREANLPERGQTLLYDGKTGEPFDQEVTVGCMYIIKLHHLVDDKLHARSIGPYSLVTQQPLGGKAQFGGQRLGEMEVWALEAYGAAHTLQEFLTVKSDDVPGRTRIYESIVKGQNTLESGLPESFNVLVKELQSLCLDVELI